MTNSIVSDSLLYFIMLHNVIHNKYEKYSVNIQYFCLKPIPPIKEHLPFKNTFAWMQRCP